MNLHRRGIAALGAAALAVTTVPALVAPASAAAKLSLVATSGDGSAFDLDEVDGSEITVQVTSSTTGPVDVPDTTDLTYAWNITPFDATVAPLRVPATGGAIQADEVDGSFVVPLPTGQPSGTYVLSAALGPDAGGEMVLRARTVLTVAAGQASITFPDDPLRVAAGMDHPVTGTLALEDGTPLVERPIDLAYAQGAAGSDPAADSGLVPDPVGPLVPSLQVSTGTDGAFTATVSDPPEDGQGTELGGSLTATAAAGPLGDPGVTDVLTVDLVGDALAEGSTITVPDLGSGKPGEALPGVVTVTAPDDTFDTDAATSGVQGDADSDPDPVEGQLVHLAVDHGFLTTGDDVLPSVVGDPAGNLEQLGATYDALTDADGQLAVAVGIGRDVAFDDDGAVTATLTGTAGALSDTGVAAWNTADPFTGGVQIVLSPDGEQPAAVDPAVTGDRTYYEVNAVDQFGNKVEDVPVDLTYSGDLDDWDYSDDFVVSDFDDAGDIWVVSFEAADIDVTGTWADAPSWTYTDTTGGSATGSGDASGTSTASFYELSFGGSTMKMSSSVDDVTPTGTAVSSVVRVTDQLGNPVRGYTVRFFRNGPDGNHSEPRVVRVTNALGEATYTFIGTQVGTARLTAEVTDGVRTRVLTDSVVFGARVSPRLSAGRNGRGPDELSVAVSKKAAGARVAFYRVLKGKAEAIAVRSLDRTAKASLSVRDTNGVKATSYYAVVRSTSRTAPATSNTVKVG